MRKETSEKKRIRFIEAIDIIINNEGLNQDKKMDLIETLIFKSEDYESILIKDKGYINGYIEAHIKDEGI